MYREKEVKYDISLDVDEQWLLRQVEQSISEFGFQIIPKRKVFRKYEYYDTSMLHALRLGETIRKISDFVPASEKGLYRYDYKIGELTNRYESNYWTSRELSVEEMKKQLKLPDLYSELEVVAVATTNHTKKILQRNATKIELALDHFMLMSGEGFSERGCEFKELELECKEGSDVENERLGQEISERLGLVQLHEQKYTRVMGLLGVQAFREVLYDTFGTDGI